MSWHCNPVAVVCGRETALCLLLVVSSGFMCLFTIYRLSNHFQIREAGDISQEVTTDLISELYAQHCSGLLTTTSLGRLIRQVCMPIPRYTHTFPSHPQIHCHASCFVIARTHIMYVDSNGQCQCWFSTNKFNFRFFLLNGQW